MPIRQERIIGPITPELTIAFSRTLSAPRWTTYLEAAGFRENVANALYLWNAAIGQSLHYPLQALEISLRNVIHASLSARLSQTWWSDPAARQVLGPERCADIDKVVQRLRRKYGGEPHMDQIVASLMLGFWAAMLKREYNEPIWDHEVGHAFPHLTGSIRDVSAAVNAVQDLRNRIFHHEPLIGRALSEDYGRITKVIGWICPETRKWVRHHSSFPTVLRQRPR